jgi:hypothetical protein
MSIGEPDGHYSFYNESRRVARKGHSCDACDRPIAPGDIYYDIRAGWEGIRTYKRCPPCQAIHKHLREKLSGNGEWPAEELDCGHEYDELHDESAPAWLQALAFWLPGDPLPQVHPCRFLYGPYAEPMRHERECSTWRAYPYSRGYGISTSKDEGQCGRRSRPLPGMQLCEQVAS